MTKSRTPEKLQWKPMRGGFHASSFYIVQAKMGIQWELQRLMPGAHLEIYGRGDMDELKALAERLARFEPEKRPFLARPGDPGYVAPAAEASPKPGLWQRAATRIGEAWN